MTTSPPIEVTAIYTASPDVQRLVAGLKATIANREANIRFYRMAVAEHESFITDLYDLLRAEKIDDAIAMVKQEYEGIHGPSVDDGREWPQADNE